jgi:hypothetical protein
MEITTQEQLVLYRLDKFYTEEHVAKIKPILEGESTISLRILDWFVTNYAKKNNISYAMSNGNHVIVYLSYKAHLKAYSKKMFDPFCRWKRLTFRGLSTTVGQLNFFAWALEDGILDYLETHRDDVHADMETRMTNTTGEKRVSTRRKRHELSHSATRSLKKHDVKIIVRFD